jgi:hypothetical protein
MGRVVLLSLLYGVVFRDRGKRVQDALAQNQPIYVLTKMRVLSGYKATKWKNHPRGLKMHPWRTRDFGEMPGYSLAKRLKNGYFLPVLGCFLACFWLRLDAGI